MSRDGSQSRIDSIRSSANTTNPLERTALNNAVRYNVMLQLFDDTTDNTQSRAQVRNALGGRDPKTIDDDLLARSLEESIQDLTREFNEEVGSDEDIIKTPQTEMTNRMFRTDLGRIVGNEITFNRGRFFEANQKHNLLSHGSAGYAFSSYLSSFQDNDDAFGSRVVYDNVFGAFENGEKSLSQRAAEIDPEDYAATSSQKVLQTLVNKNILDSRHSLNKVDREFQRFFGQSAVAAASQSGTGLVRARQILETSIEKSLELQQYYLNTEQYLKDNPQNALFQKRLTDIQNQINDERLTQQAYLDEIKEGYSVRRTNESAPGTRIINKAGVREFVDLFNSADSEITIQTYQLQNQTIGSSIRDVMRRRVIEKALTGDTKGFKLNLVLAYPKQRINNGGDTEDDRYNIGGTGYAINGPNLIEALTIKQFEEDLVEELVQLGYAKADAEKLINVNLEFRDRKFHPKLYMTDTMAAIGTQNLTAPVGNSINQAGSNFEQMYIARNYIMSDDELMASRTQGAIRSEKSLQGKVRSSLLYRQIRQASEFERDFIARQANSGRVLPAMNIGGKSLGSNYNVGFAGDIYKHLTDTLDYAYQNSIGVVHHTTSSSGGRAMPGPGDRSLNMFMILDGSFMLQLGDIAFQEKALLGEMGDEVTKTFRAKDARVAKYRQYQNKLFDLLITNNANVVVDKKNYQEQVYDPIADKIEKAGSEKLKRNFAKAGKNLGLMAGNAIYGSDIEGMDRFLQSQGFTDDAGFSASDRKQIMGMGSGNIRMAKVPRQHAKSFGLVDYTNGAPDLISYYQGSSNMGFYSLDAADKTNAEMGVMFGKGTGLSRVKDQVYISSYAGDADIEAVREATQNAIDTANQFRDFALTEDEEINELRNIQDRFYQTYNQLSSNTIQNRYIDNVSNAPMWQSNVNSGALQVQKARLEDLRTTLGLTDTAFKIQERIGEDGGVKSLNITINMASILGSDDFTNSTTPGKKLTFEISVLNSPKDRRIINQNSSTDPRNGSSDVPGMVYFVDKNKLIGNGIFVNDSGQSVDVLGRKGFNDQFQYGLDAGTTTVKSGEFAHMSSIDMTTNIFGQLLGEAMTQQTIEEPARRYARIVERGLENELLTDYLAVLLRGRSSHISKDGKEMTALDIISNMKAIELEELGGMILTKTKSRYGSVAEIRNLTPTAFKQLNATQKGQATLDFINSFRYALADKNVNLFGNNNNISFNQRTNVLEDTNKPFLSNEGLAKEFLDTYLLPHFQKVVQTSPELRAEILKYADSNNYADIEKTNISAKQAMIFEPFLQSVEDTTYGGQQGYYRTLMYGLSGMNPGVDFNTAEIMDDYDDKPGLHQARRFARLTALSYTPTTDIHEFLYRSIASGASSTGKTDQSLNSSLLKQQGRQVGNAQNFDVLQSVGIGTKIDRSTYVEGFADELKITGEFLQSLKDQGLDDSQIKIIQDRLKEDYKNQSREFMAISTTDRNGQLQTKATNNMLFFTGNAGKISQLPQRIKNALGARPLYQYGIEAQRAMTQTAFEDGGSLKDITANYVNKQGQAVDELLEYQIQKQNDILKTTRLDSDANNKASNKLQLINQFKQDLSLKKVRSNTGQTIGYEAGQLFKMGAVYTGRIKSVLSADQALYVARIREDIETIFNDADIDTYGLSDEERNKLLAQQKETKEELIRSYVLRASLDNSGLGKMIAGNDRTKYNIALLQMSGTYTDTFVANPLLGNVYNNQKAYNTLKRSGANLESLDLTKEVLIDGVKQKLSDYVVVSGQREGYLVTQQMSTKGSMMAEQEDLRATDTEVEGERMLFREGDVVAEDDQGRFVYRRDGRVIRTAGNKRTFSTLRGEVDNTSFGVSSSLATKSTAAYGRRGEHSVDYIFASMERDGNFANNEYLQELIRLRSIVAGGGRRVEGTDSSALVKGVANFAGQGIYRHKDKFVSMNTFQYLETQIEDKFDEGQVGGSLAAMLRAENRTYVFNNEGYYTPLSSMISGVYNANNFKSFVWSHGATILKETKGTGQVENNFMLNELLGIGQNLTDADRLKLAQKAASGLLISFGSSYLKGGDSAEFQESIIRGLKQGAAGRNYQKLVGAMTILNQGQMSDSALFKEIVSKTKESQGIYFSDANLAGLRGLDAKDIEKVMSGDPSDPETMKATKRFMSQIEGMLVSQAKDIAGKGYMEMSSFSHRQAALITTAIDIMHQISANETAYRLPSDIDKGSEKIKQVMTSILGGEDFMTASNQKVFGTDRQGLMDEAFEMIQGINENVNMVALYADIAYSQSKDATGTETVGRHEAQHLMMPFLGDIQAFSKEGQLSNMQHIFASLMALSQGTNSIMAYNALNKSGFSNAKAWNMSTVNDEQRLLMSSFTQQDFLGFYRSTTTDQQKNTLLKREFKNINKIIASGKYHNLDTHTTFDISTPEGKQQQAAYAKRMASLNKDVEDYVTRFYSLNGGTLDNRVKQQKIAEINAKIFGADGSIIKEGVTEFLMNRQELVVMELDKLNNVYNANQNKALGSDATSNFIDSMQNKEMFFSLPELKFDTQDGMAKVTTRGSINTFLPAAKMMKKLGVQHADFIDPLIGVYKDLAEVFVPGSIAHNALTKVYASQKQGQTAILTAIESEALQRVMSAATRMPIEAQKAIEGARAQEAFASKVKYKGFTSTGIGSFLVPFDAVALASSKLAEAGFDLNDRKTKALQQTLERRNNLITHKKALSDSFFEGPDDEYERVKVEKLKRDMARIERAQQAEERRKARGEKRVPKYQNYELYESNDVTKKYIEGLIPGKALEYSKSLEGMKNRVKVYYDLQMTAVVQGVSKDIIESYKEMVATSRLLKGTVDTLFEDIGLGRTTLQGSQEEILKLYSFRDKVKGRLKDNMQSHDRFAYETVSMNLDAMINDLEIKSRSTRTKMDSGEFGLKRLDSDQVAARETKKEIYQNVTSVLNIVDESGEKAFSHLGADTTGMKAYELFDERYAPSGGLTLGEISRTSSIVKALEGLQKDVTDKTIRTKTQKELALNYLNDLKTQQEKHLADFRNFTNVRDDGTLDAEKERAAYAEMLKSHENILNSIESARLDVVSGVMEEEGGVDRIFTSLNTSMIINNKINLQFAEVFRSPPPGSTDPRLHSYRIMNGVTALNRIANMTGAGGMSETRNQTSTYITAVGMVTYGGGDFDGDPYTAIIHNREKTARAIMNKRLDIQRDEATLRAFAQTPLSQNATPKQIAERQAKEAQLQSNVAKRKEELAIEEKRFDKQLKVGYQEFDARARRQAAEYYGIDERILVKGKDLHNKIDAEEYIDPDNGEIIRGLGTKTYNADTVFTLMNTGHGLVEGLDQKGKDLMTLYDTFDQAFGIRKDSFEALKKMRAVAQSFNNLRDAKTGMIKESAQGEVLKLFRESMGTTVNLANADDTGIIATVLRNNDSETAKVMLEAISDIQDQEISFRRERGFSQDILDASDQNKARSQEFVHHFIGGALMAQMQAHDTYTGFMKKGAGMQINEGGMDMLLKTLGKAGGEVLGKTYNTIIGTTFKDSPLISFATSVLDPKERGEGSLYDVITQEFIAKANGNEEMGKQSASDYFGSLKHALDKARGTQGFMKNIHQLLRDSIKLKSDKDMISELEKASVDYSTIAEKLRKHDLANKGTEGYLKERNALLLERDAAINRLSSGLGDGPGLKALVDLDFLINQSKKADPNEKPGLTVGQFSSMFLEGGDIKSAEFNTMVDRYDQEIEEQLKLIEGDTSREGDLKRSKLLESRLSEEERARLSSLKPTDSGSETGLLKVAQYRVANQLTNLVSGYRMSTSITLKAGELESQAQSYLTLKQEEAYHSGRGLLSKGVVQQEVLDDYKIPDNPLDVKSEAGKARKLRKIEALSQYLGVDNSSFYQGNAAQAQVDLDKKLDAAAKKAGLSRESYLLTFDQRYENSREQARAMIGSSGEGLTTFTNLEGVRSDMSNMFKSGDQGRDDRMNKLLGIMDAEALQMASQLIGSDKLMTGGFDAFNKLFEGILSNVMVDELDKVQADLIEVAKKESPGVTEEALLKDPTFQKRVSDAKEKIVRKKSIQLTLGGGPGDRSTSEEGATVRSVTTELMESEAVQKAYTQSMEGSLASQQAEAVQKLADHMILKGSESEDQFNKLLDAIGTRAGSPDELSAEQQRQNLRSRLKEQQTIKFNKAVRQQMADRQKMADDNPYLKRGSMLSKLSDTMIGSMATNKGSTTLDLLAPIAITAIGAAVAEGDVNAETMQELAGATVTSLMYARTGFIDGNAKTYAKRMAGAQAISSVFKFRSALNRYEGQGYAEGEKIAMAARDTVVRESISMAVNRALAPALTRNIASKLGNNTSIASDLLTGKKHQAVQQISGNIGASLISAATSTMISGLILKTTVPNPEKKMYADLQQFEVNVATVNSVNQQIAAARAQQAASEDVEVQESGGEPEVSAYNVVTSSTYGADSRADSFALEDFEELELGNDGSLAFNFG